MAFDAAIKFLEDTMGKPLDDCVPVPVSPDEYLEIMWSLNDVFKEHVHLINSVKYKKAFEKSADKAVEKFAFGDAERKTISSGTWRVLLERHKQMLTVALANKHAGESSITVLPHGFPEDQKQAALMLLLLRRMKLPYKVNDQQAVGWLASDGSAPLRLQ